MDDGPVPSKRTLLRHGSLSTAHSALTLAHGMKFLEFQKIRKSLCLWAHCQTPGHLIVDAANLSSEGRQPALPHHGLRCHPCQANGDGSCFSNLLIHQCQTCRWLPEIGQHRQSTFSSNECYLGLFVGHNTKDLLYDHNFQSSFPFCDKLS